MTTATVTPIKTGTRMYTVVTNGVSRQFEGKFTNGELRVYRLYGDASDMDEVAEALQELSVELNVPVRYRQ